jgi:hypothetical protein
MLDLLAGRRRVSPVVAIATFGVANATTLMTISSFNQMIGTKTLRIKRLKIANIAGGNTWFNIGTGVAGTWVAGIASLYTVNNTTDDYEEGDLPQWETNLTITGWPTANAGAFNITLEVEELG